MYQEALLKLRFFLPQTQAILADIGYPVEALLVFLLPNF